MKELLQFPQNLIKTRKNLGIKIVDFARELGVEYRTYQNYERGERQPRIEFYTQLVHKYNVSLNFLLCGIGPMFLPPSFEDARAEIISEVEEMLRQRGL